LLFHKAFTSTLLPDLQAVTATIRSLFSVKGDIVGRPKKATNSEIAYAEINEAIQPDTIDWDDFRIFLAIVKAGSLNRAADLLGIVQPTVSRRLARLEKCLGIRLFDRSTSGPRLTFEGRRVLNSVSMAQLSLAQATRNAQAVGPKIEGECKLVMGDGLASYWMPLFLDSFFDRYPNVQLKNFVAQDASAGKNEIFDIHVHYYEPAEIDPIAMRVATLHFIPFASPTYLRKHGTPRSMEDLRDHRLLDLSLYLIDKGSWSAWWANRTSPGTSLLTNQSAPLAEAVKRGAGIALLPTYVTLVDDSFIPLDLGLRFQVPVFLSYQRDALTRWPVRAALDFLRTTVFDRRLMPWFGEQYESPSLRWKELFDDILNQSSEPARHANGAVPPSAPPGAPLLAKVHAAHLI
jgi:DNA-binding transcriptional LysR family regulator